jgi:hypothetical protein
MLQAKKKRARYAAVAAWMMMLCLAVGVGRLALALGPALDPSLSAAEISCSLWYCELDNDPRLLLGEFGGPPLMSTDLQRVVDVISEPSARLLIGAAGIVQALPWAAMFLLLALAFRSIRQRGSFADAAARLRSAALAALIGTLLEPVASTLRATALSPILTGERQLYFFFNGRDVFWGVMVAGTAFVVVWVLDRALAAERELAEIV